MIIIKKNITAVIIVVLSLLALVGTGQIYSIVENIENNTNAFYARAENDITGVKINERIQNMAKNASSVILDSGAKSKISQVSAGGDRIVCYMKNVYMELDTVSMRPILLFYECAKNEPKLKNEECRMLAMRFTLRNIPRKTKVNGCEITDISSGDRIYSYMILFGGKKVLISLRADTGSVIFYDASELF